jgi:hypothetical protein
MLKKDMMDTGLMRSGNKFDEVKVSSALSDMNLYEKYEKKSLYNNIFG